MSFCVKINCTNVWINHKFIIIAKCQNVLNGLIIPTLEQSSIVYNYL